MKKPNTVPCLQTGLKKHVLIGYIIKGSEKEDDSFL